MTEVTQLITNTPRQIESFILRIISYGPVTRQELLDHYSDDIYPTREINDAIDRLVVAGHVVEQKVEETYYQLTNEEDQCLT